MRLQHLTTGNLEAICRLADLAKNASNIPSTSPPILPSIQQTTDTAALDRAMTAGMPPARIALLRQIQSLSSGAIIELAILCWFGRGDAPIEQLSAYAEQTYGPTLAYYLADKPFLGEYLRAGFFNLDAAPDALLNTRGRPATSRRSQD